MMSDPNWTPKLRPNRREDYSTMITGVKWIIGPCPMWMAAMRRWHADDGEMIDYLQRVFGYSATPHTTEQCFFFTVARVALAKERVCA